MTIRTVFCLAAFAAASCAPGAAASISIHQDDSLIVDTFGLATFDDLEPGESLLDYQEDGLRLNLDDIQGGGFVPPGFDGPGFYYPTGGGFDLIQITRTDGMAFDVLEMNVSSGLADGSTNFMWIQAWNDGQLVAEFDTDVAQGTLIGVSGVFDEVRLASYFSVAQRDAHDTSNLNVLALDNVTFGAVPGPGTLVLLIVSAVRARSRMRDETAPAPTFM